MKAVLSKVSRIPVVGGSIGGSIGEYIVHYTLHWEGELGLALVYDPALQMHTPALRLQSGTAHIVAVDELDATVKGLQRLREVYGANNVSLGGSENNANEANEALTKEN